MKYDRLCADDLCVMNTNCTTQSSADRSSTDLQVANPTETNSIVAISALELAKLVESGHGTDVNELVNRVLHDRQQGRQAA